MTPKTDDTRPPARFENDLGDVYTELKGQQFKPSSSLSGARNKVKRKTFHNIQYGKGGLSSTN